MTAKQASKKHKSNKEAQKSAGAAENKSINSQEPEKASSPAEEQLIIEDEALMCYGNSHEECIKRQMQEMGLEDPDSPAHEISPPPPPPPPQGPQMPYDLVAEFEPQAKEWRAKMRASLFQELCNAFM